MTFKKIAFFFLLFRILDFLILFFAPYFIPYLGFFPYKEVLANYHLPSWLTSLANFDGVHYLLIAQKGYSQYEQAFFPLYPLLIKILSPVFFGNSLIAALFISNLSFLGGLYIFSQLLKIYQITNNKYLITIFLLFPTSFFFGAVYTEGLFFFLMIASLYFLEKKKYFSASFFALSSSLTRLIGVFLIIPFLFHFFQYQISKSKKQNDNSKCKNSLPSFLKLLITNNQYLITILSPLIGLFLYCFYLWQTTGDPLFFLTSQPAFGAHRSTTIVLLPQVVWRYLKILFTASFNFQYYVSVFEFLIFFVVFFVVVLNLFQDLFFLSSKTCFGISVCHPEFISGSNKMPKLVRHDKLALILFSLVNLLLPTLTGTFSSIPRYSLFSLSFFIYLSQIKNKWIKISVILVFLIFHIISLAFFSQGYFIS